MPTPVSSARQCLTQEAAHALDEAVAVARRRSHSQTTSLHAVSALLSLPSSVLRDACFRARNSAYYPTRIQIKALELSLSGSLDRQPSGQKRVENDGPPVSNSLMAAIKRSQANQRRHPENFHLYHQQMMQQQQSSPSSSSSSPSVSCVKVELRHLILSILDDPVVSRVFGEAGFRSWDVKLAIVRPLPPPLLRYPRARSSPLFLCNLGDDSDLGGGGRPFSFPFLGFSDADEDCRRIGEVLGKNNGRNPLLVGLCAKDALRSFEEVVEGKKCGVLPLEISGLSIISVENEISKYVTGKCDEGSVNSRFEEVGKMAERCLGPGWVVNYGDLKVLISEDSTSVVDAVNYIVAELTKLLKVKGGKMWLLGAAESFETYLMFLSRFPSIEEEWDLQLLHITSLRVSMGRPYSGSSSYPCRSRCQLCNEKCEHELTALSKGVFTASIADQYQSSLPYWLQMSEFGANKRLDVVQAKDDGLVLNAKVAGLQKKWDGICQHLHTRPLYKTDEFLVNSQVPELAGCYFGEGRNKSVDNYIGNNINDSPKENGRNNLNSCMSTDSPKTSVSNLSASVPVICKAKDDNYFAKIWEEPSRAENLEPGGLKSPFGMSNSSSANRKTSPSSITSVTTDLGLGISVPSHKELKKPLKQPHFEYVRDLSRCNSTIVDLSIESVSRHASMSSSSSCLDICGQFGGKDFKTIYRTLTEMIGWQVEAISVISEAIAHHRASNDKCHREIFRRAIWLNFLGPDRYSKKKIAVALAELFYGSRQNFVSVDFGSPDGIGTIHATSIFNFGDMNHYSVMPRGNTIIDYIAGELNKKPLSVVFLENVDKANVLAQNSLSYAVRTGKFPDSHGREVAGNDASFITTSSGNEGKDFLSSEKEVARYKEKILIAKSGSMEIVIGHTANSIANPLFMNKRKVIGCNETLKRHGSLEMAKRVHKASPKCLDLNLPAEENEVQPTDHEDFNVDPFPDNSNPWLEEFLGLVDETVVFKPFDIDALAEKVMKDVSESFHKIVSSECLLEIDSKVLEQIVVAAYLSDSDRMVEDWVEQILSRGFTEARKMYNLTARSVVKLVSLEGNHAEQQASDVCLPTKINLNPNPQDAFSCNKMYNVG